MVVVAPVILARADSARLPGKILLDAGGLPLLDLVVARLRRGDGHEPLLATTDRPVDDALADHARAIGVGVFRGSATDVATRLLGAARSVGADYVARINADSPFTDPALLDQARLHLDGGARPDLVTNIPGRTFPYGVSVEVIRCDTLAALLPAFDPVDREHVTRHLYARLDAHDVQTIRSPRPDLAGIRMTVDTPDDLARLRLVAGILGHRLLEAGWCEAAEAYRSLGPPTP